MIDKLKICSSEIKLEMIPIIISVRGVFFVSVLLIVLSVFVMINNSKDKPEYEKTTGRIDFFAKEFQHFPVQHKGDFRYLKLNTYPYVFEIYEPNSKPTEKKIDDLKVGDEIDVYYYETSNTRNEGINRFTQFIDKDEQPYFIRNGFQKQLAFVCIGLVVFMNVMTWAFWKKGKLNW